MSGGLLEPSLGEALRELARAERNRRRARTPETLGEACERLDAARCRLGEIARALFPNEGPSC